jgi:hypothetical protein
MAAVPIETWLHEVASELVAGGVTCPLSLDQAFALTDWLAGLLSRGILEIGPHYHGR